MRNQQTKKVNRIFFSGQDEEKRKWIEQMAAEGWQLISGTSFVYSFQRITSENEGIQPSYKSILGLDLQKSMPIFQDAIQSRVPLLIEQNHNLKTPLLASLPRMNEVRQPNKSNNRHRWLGIMALSLFLIMSFTKIAIFSTGDFVSLFKWQFVSSVLLIGFGLIVGTGLLLKSLAQLVALECKSKE